MKIDHFVDKLPSLCNSSLKQLKPVMLIFRYLICILAFSVNISMFSLSVVSFSVCAHNVCSVYLHDPWNATLESFLSNWNTIRSLCVFKKNFCSLMVGYSVI